MAGFLLADLVAVCLILFSWIVIFATRQGNIDFLDSFVFSIIGLFLGILCLFVKLSSRYDRLANYLFDERNLVNNFLAWIVLILSIIALCGILHSSYRILKQN